MSGVYFRGDVLRGTITRTPRKQDIYKIYIYIIGGYIITALTTVWP